MMMLYDSEAYAVLRFELEPGETGATSRRGGFDIVDKRMRREIFLSGELAHSFQQGAQALSASNPDPEQWDEYIARFTELGQQPLVMH
jgi:hypothetical protein